MSDYPMLISNKLHSFRNFFAANLLKIPIAFLQKMQIFAVCDI